MDRQQEFVLRTLEEREIRFVRDVGDGEDRVGEEGPDAPGVVVRRVEHHALAAAQVQHRHPGGARGDRRVGAHTEGAGQLGVADRGARAVRAQPEPDPQHHRVVAVFEHARAVSQSELGGRDVRAQLAGAPVVEIDVDEYVGNLDPVGAHVLHRGPAHAHSGGDRSF